MGAYRFSNARVWDERHRRWTERGVDFDWGGFWTEPWLPHLAAHGCRDVLELGCGAGGDALRLASAGLRVAAFDVSWWAVRRARERALGQGLRVDLLAADMGGGLPFRDGTFDAAVANVSLHYFPDDETRGVVSEVRRVLRPGGLLLFHVNSTAEREVNGNHLSKREVAPGFYVGEDGSTARLFREEDVRDLMRGWSVRLLEQVDVPEWAEHRRKTVWRCVAAAQGR